MIAIPEWAVRNSTHHAGQLINFITQFYFGLVAIFSPTFGSVFPHAREGMMRLMIGLTVSFVLCSFVAAADYRITEDRGGSIESYKAKYAEIGDRGERVIIDGVCESACTLVFGIVPSERICATPRASLGFHMPYYNLAATGGVKVVSYEATADFMSSYPEAVKEWLSRQGGLTADTKKVTSGPDLWGIVNPCPEVLP